MKDAIIISGDFHNLIARKKSSSDVEIGSLLVSEGDKKHVLQVVNMSYGSQISQNQIELISGLNLEENEQTVFKDHNTRHYILLQLKNLISINSGNGTQESKNKDASLSKTMPKFFSELREIREDDLNFLPKEGMYVGHLRSGSKQLNIPIYLPTEKVLSHHILLSATTGRGKSNFTSNILYNLIDDRRVGFLVLDPHDEYYGRTSLGLKDHPDKDKVIYYTLKDPPVGARHLKINISKLSPNHFYGVLNLTDPQRDMMILYHRRYGGEWIKRILTEKEGNGSNGFNEATQNALKRKLMRILDIKLVDDEITCNGIFDTNAGKSTVDDIIRFLEESRTVIIDTSSFSGSAELLIGSLLANSLLNKYRGYKRDGTIDNKPIISIVLEEAPRVLGKEILEKGTNVFESIAREGRKFKIGLYAITQLPSLIPRQILANMNTKIIMGMEMHPERESIIQSSSHDLTEYGKAIASLDKGEAIVSSNFSIFPIPIKAPLFSHFVENQKNAKGTSEEHEHKNIRYTGF